MAPSGLSITSRFVGADLIVLAAVTTPPDATCPVCRTPSAHVHSRYLRTVADLPSHGRRVVWRITARRFRCRHGGCPRTVFCERLPVIRPHARATDPLAHAQRDVALAVGGQAGSRLCRRLAFPTSGDTLLRRVRAIPPPTAPMPRVLGVDDFAFRKGHTYGTILVDLERGRVIDLLPDRTAATLTAWLKRHPGIRVISRDRASAYSQAATDAAPNAVQVADRFHLLVNLREAVERALQQRTAAIRGLVAKPPPPDTSPPPAVGTAESAAADVGRRQELFERVRRLHRDGLSLRRIARELNLHYRTVERYVRSDACPDWNAGQPRASRWDRHAEWIRGRLRDGCSAAQVHRELAAGGHTGGVTVITQYVRRLRAEMGLAPARPSRPLGAETLTPAPPTARRLSVAVVRHPDRRTDEEREWVARLKELDSDVRVALAAAEEFAGLVRERSGAGVDGWLNRADAIPTLKSFAAGLRRDEAAVRAGLTLPWSNGPVEGAVNRLKLLKRAGYGRAKFDLLRARVLHRG
jgi:transposase